MGYVFRLGGLLKMLERERDHRQALVNQHQQYLERIEAECRLIYESMQRSQTEFQQFAQASSGPEMLGRATHHYQTERDCLHRLIRLHQTVEEQLTEMQSNLLKAKQGLRRVEILKERHQERRQTEALAVQQAVLDEFGILQAARSTR